MDDRGSGGRRGDTEGLKICLICGHRLVRDILARALTRELRADVDRFNCCEDALCSDLNHDMVIVYDYFGNDRMNGPQGTKRLRVDIPDAYILGVTHNPGFDKQFLQAGADTALVAGEKSVKKILRIARHRVVTTLYPSEAQSLSGHET